MPLQLNDLPQELLVKIFDLPGTRDRAKLSLVCKSWDQLVNTSWTSISLNSNREVKLEARLSWLNTVVKQSSPFLHTLRISYPPGKHNTKRMPYDHYRIDYIDLIGCNYDPVGQLSTSLSHLHMI